MSDNSDFSPESLMMSFGHDPSLVRNSIKNPIFQTSTFEFTTAEEGKAFFENVYGDGDINEKNESLIYTRLNHPNLITAEKRLALLDGTEDAAFFESGMAAITTSLLEFSQNGNLILMSSPLYGSTDAFIKNILPRYGIEHLVFDPRMTKGEIIDLVDKYEGSAKLSMIYCETPANPTNSLIDIKMMAEIRDHFSTENNIVLAVDNTYMGPLFQKPQLHGADLILYSATKYIGGHSDLIAGACSGNKKLMLRIKGLRSKLGCMASPNTSWLICRSLETLHMRMEKHASNAKIVANFLSEHPTVKNVLYAGNLKPGDAYFDIFQKQCTSGGAMLAFDVEGGEKGAFLFLNNLKLIKLAVSLGSTETLASHPDTMSSSNVPVADRLAVGITPAMIRLSVGIENPEDLIKDINYALDQT
jgi:methionine-gamma-lyase